MRDNPGTSGKQVGKLNSGQEVTVRGGPVEADNFVWWQIDNGAGLTGWVAAGPADSPWLVPEGTAAAAQATPGGERLVQRPVRTGDRVQVTTAEGKLLTIREAAGKDARNMANVVAGTRFSVRGGPEQRDGLTWWELEGDQVKGWAAEGDGSDRWLTPIER